MRIAKGDLVVVKRGVERGNNTMSQFNLEGQKLDILKLEKGSIGIVLESHERSGWMSKYRVLFETGHAFWLWDEEIERVS